MRHLYRARRTPLLPVILASSPGMPKIQQLPGMKQDWADRRFRW
ncbi:hypothetical protein [Mycolicibacterium sp. HS_4_1]